MAKSPYVRTRQGEKTPGLFDTPAPPGPPDDPDRAMAVLNAIGTRIIPYNNFFAVTTPIVPNEEMIAALAALGLNLAVLLINSGRVMDLHYEMLPRGWLPIYRRDGMAQVLSQVRNAVTLMPNETNSAL